MMVGLAEKSFPVKLDRENWREIFDKFPRLVWLEDDNERIINVNQAFMILFGLNYDEVIGKKITDLPLVSVSREGKRKSYPYYLEIAGAEGKIFRNQIMACPFFSGEATMFTGCQVDVYSDFQKSLQLYVQAITSAHEQERLRISRDLHDSIIQSLIAILHQTESFLYDNQQLPIKIARFLWDLREQMRNTIQEVRYLSMNLRPCVLDLGLVPALEWLIGQVSNEYGLEISFACKGTERRLLAEGELCAFRIAQEALHNVVKHAQTTRAEVVIEFTEYEVRISVADDGKGMKYPNSLEELLLTGKYGLAGIFERAQILGGSAKIMSPAGHTGSIIEVRFPLSKNTPIARAGAGD